MENKEENEKIIGTSGYISNKSELEEQEIEKGLKEITQIYGNLEELARKEKILENHLEVEENSRETQKDLENIYALEQEKSLENRLKKNQFISSTSVKNDSQPMSYSITPKKYIESDEYDEETVLFLKLFGNLIMAGIMNYYDIFPKPCNMIFGACIFAINFCCILETHAQYPNEFLLLFIISALKGYIYGYLFYFHLVMIILHLNDIERFTQHLIPGSLYGPEHLKRQTGISIGKKNE